MGYVLYQPSMPGRRWWVPCLLLAAWAVLASAPAGAGLGDWLREKLDDERPPPRDYVILINYELGMHCTGFDFSYCCVLPPYNSILAQVVRTERHADRPRLLAADPRDPTVLVDGKRRFRLAYTHEDPAGVPNTYSATKKLDYWGLGYRGGQLPNHEFAHLYVYDPADGGSHPRTTADRKKRHIGLDTPIHINEGPTGQHVGKGYLRYSGREGTVVFTDSPVMENVPIHLTGPGIWEALGLPLTPFNDRFTSLLTVQERQVQPFQRAVVTLVDADTGEPVIDSSGQVVRYFGVNPIDIPNCARCHAGPEANGEKYRKYQEEYAFWRGIRGASDWYARLKAAAISILEIHDDRNGTNFLAHWPAGPGSHTRLGRDPVVCQDCHADNIIGRLVSRHVGEMRPEDVRPGAPSLPPPEHLISPLSEAIHKVHLRVRPLGDAEGLAGSCQACHPGHRSSRTLQDFPLDVEGRYTYRKGDIRGTRGCFTQRDAHGNPDFGGEDLARPDPLTPVGRYLLLEVMQDDRRGRRGLYCTHCHNLLSRALYRADHLASPFDPETGRSLRALPLERLAQALGMDLHRLLHFALDPRVPARGPDTRSGVYHVWDRTGQRVADLARIRVDAEGRPLRTPPDEDGDRSLVLLDPDPEAKGGVPLSYDEATHGRDYWLAPGEPHCADCHAPPFVEDLGGANFPIDQPGKYALMRHSRGHRGITCQGCHESTHGLYPVNPAVDVTGYQQAAQLNPDGSHGPVKCQACHRVNAQGVPTRHPDYIARDSVYWKDYGKAVELQHELR